MEIQYRDKRLRQLCEVRATADKGLGPRCAAKLRIRLAALEAATRVTDLAAGHPHPLKGDRVGQFALSLTGGTRLVFSVAQSPCPVGADGCIDWSRVTMIRIEFLGDYHD